MFPKRIESKCGLHRQFDQDGLAAQYFLLSYPNANHDCGCCMIPIPHFESKSDEMSVRKAPDLGHFGVCISFTSFSLISLTVIC